MTNLIDRPMNTSTPNTATPNTSTPAAPSGPPSMFDRPLPPPPDSPVPPLPPAPHDGPPPSNRRGRGRVAIALVVGALVGVGGTLGVDAIVDHNSSGTPSAAVAPAAGGGAAPDASPHSGGSAATSNGINALVVRTRPSIVAIHDSMRSTNVFGQPVEGQAAGSGFVLSADGYIVTNNHVIDGADDITVSFNDGSTEKATVVGADPRSDLAVLHVDRTDLTPLPLGDSDDLLVGEPVVAIGNALDLGADPTVTSGIVSATDRSLTEENHNTLVHLLQTDTAINPGNSGGPLLSMDGKVIGINTAIAGQAQNIGFAIEIGPAKHLIDQLRNGDVPEHALLGVSLTNTPDGSPGAFITAVSQDSAASEGGLQVGDVITEVDGTTVGSPNALIVQIDEHAPGDQLKLTVLRNGKKTSADVTLQATGSDGD